MTLQYGVAGGAMRKYLTQAALVDSISRIEDAARTQAEFDNVIELWDMRDKRKNDAFNKKMMPLANETFDVGVFKKGSHKTKNQFGGRNHYIEDFLTPLYCCICQMHNLTDDADLSRLIDKVTDKQKAVFFPRVLKSCSPQKIALCHGMTDRNVRDIVDRTIAKICKGMYGVLKQRQADGVSMTIQQRDFMNTIDEEMEKTGEAKKPIKPAKSTKTTKRRTVSK